MKLKDFLDMTGEESMLHLIVDERTLLIGYTYHFYQDFSDIENDEFNSYIKDYVDCEVDAIEWTTECLYVYVNTKEINNDDTL